MKLIILLAIILIALSVQGATLVSTNPQPTAMEYRLSGGPGWLPAQISGQTLRIDLGSYTEGTWAIKVKACKTDPLWGLQCSPEGDYTLTCPSPTGGLVEPILEIIP